MPEGSDDSAPETPPQSKRKRSRRACEPCRRRKKKCDGQQPCRLCVNFEYDCTYADIQPRQRRPASNEGSASMASSSAPVMMGGGGELPTSAARITDNVFASSVFTFPSLLAQSMSTGGEQSTHRSMYTLGLRERSHSNTILTLRHLIVLEDVLKYSRRHFAIVQVWHDYLDQADFEASVISHWQDESIQAPVFETLVAFIVASGSFFSWPSRLDSEEQIVSCVESWISTNTFRDASGPTNMGLVAAYIEMTLYYRATASLRLAWMSSCSAVHLAESMGLHKEWDNLFLVLPKERPSPEELDRRRRLFWVAKNINTMISAEYGRSRVYVIGMTSLATAVERKNGEPASILSHLVSMLPDDSYPSVDLLIQGCIASIDQLSQTPCSHTYAQLVKGEMACLAYRRLVAAGFKPTGFRPTEPTKQQILTMGQEALQAAIELADNHVPWWKLNQTPFLFLCTILSMDDQESLALVPDTLRAIAHIHAIFNTSRTNDVKEAAQLLTRVALRRNENQLLSLKQGLEETDQAFEQTTEAELEQMDINWAEFMSGDIWNFDPGI